MNKMTDSDKRRLGTTDLTKRIRTNLKTTSPNFNFSVTKDSYAGGKTITVALMVSDIKIIKDFNDINFDIVNPNILDRHTIDSIKALHLSDSHDLNHYSFNDDYNPRYWSNGVFLTKAGHTMLKKVSKIVGNYNYDNSDPMTDYFDVNFYFDLRLGKWDKPFIDGGVSA